MLCTVTKPFVTGGVGYKPGQEVDLPERTARGLALDGVVRLTESTTNEPTNNKQTTSKKQAKKPTEHPKADAPPTDDPPIVE